MTSCLFRKLKYDIIVNNVQQIRHAHRLRGLMPGVAKTLQQRLEEMNYEDPELSFKVNIGFKLPDLSRAKITEKYTKHIKEVRSHLELEKKARHRELLVDLKEIKKDWWTMNGPAQVKTICDHYGIYNDLFGDAYFYPVVPLNIEYNLVDTENIATVHRGNILTPSETSNPPTVTYDAEPHTLWSLLLTTPDGNFTDRELEYCHWFVGNIPENNLAQGDLLVDYMRPIPANGIGYCRYVFVLYKQNKRIDFTEYKLSQPCFELEKRNWKTQDFYKKYQDVITPAGLAFYQASWDDSLQNFYRHTLEMKSPKFEYDFPAPYIRKQEWFPKGRPFNLYLDKYRDPKDINKDFLLKKMKTVHPFKESPPPLRYPDAHPFPQDMPSWLKLELRKERQGLGRVKEIN